MILLYSVRDKLKKKYMPSQIMGVSRLFSVLECVDRYESVAMLSELTKKKVGKTEEKGKLN